jgi:hypothetical protein
MSERDNQHDNESEYSNLTDLEIRKLLQANEAEERLLDLEEKRERSAARKAKKAEKLADASMKANQVRAMLQSRERLKKFCTHKKGGRGPGAVMNGQGTDDQYAILKHVLPSGRYFILCQRCGGEWVSRDPLTGEAGSADFDKMNSVPTDNTISGSTLFLPTRVIS